VSDIGIFIALPVLIAFFYFVTIRPENKRKKQLAEMRSSLEIGDDVTTAGGIIGKIVHVTEDTVTFETSEDRVRIKVAKWAVSNKGDTNADSSASK
jgi:preprotein translocase, YajC subunit